MFQDKIIVLRRNKIGDAIYTALVIRELLKNNRFYRFEIMANKYALPIYRNLLPNIKVHVISDTYFGVFWLNYFNPTFRKIRKIKFDLAVNASATYSTKAIFLLLCTGARLKVAVPNLLKSKILNLFIDNKLLIKNNNAHQIIKVHLIFKSLGYNFDVPEKFITDERQVQKILLCPNSTYPNDQWGLSKWLELYHKLCADGYIVNFCVLPNTFKTMPNVIIPADTNNFIEQVGMFDLVISQEGGSGHVAAMLKKKIVILSNRNVMEKWHPWATNYLYIQETPLDNLSVVYVYKRVINYIEK